MAKTTLLFLAILLSIPSARSQDLDAADVRISLDQALPIAITKAKADFPDLEKYILYSVHPRVLKGDADGLFWEVVWEEKAFPHYKQLRVRVYMSNGSTKCFRTEKGTTPRAHGTRGEGRWHQAFQGRLAKVEVDRTLYERRKDEDCFIAVRVTNVTNRPVGVDLRKFWDVIYPNSRGFSNTPAPGVVDEKRMIREPISADDKNRLMLDYSDHRLTTIMPHRSVTYLRGFTIGRNIRKEIDSANYQYFIVGLDGALEITDGQTIEEMIFPANDEGAELARWVAIRLPATWQTVSQNSLVVK